MAPPMLQATESWARAWERLIEASTVGGGFPQLAVLLPLIVACFLDVFVNHVNSCVPCM